LVILGIGTLALMLLTIAIILPIFNRRLRHSLPWPAFAPQDDIIAPLQ
jgi:hypothetical protein